MPDWAGQDFRQFLLLPEFFCLRLSWKFIPGLLTCSVVWWFLLHRSICQQPLCRRGIIVCENCSKLKEDTRKFCTQ